MWLISHLRTLTKLQDWLLFWTNALFSPRFLLLLCQLLRLNLLPSDLNPTWREIRLKYFAFYLTLTAEWSKLAGTLLVTANLFPCLVLAEWCGLFWSLLQPLPVSCGICVITITAVLTEWVLRLFEIRLSSLFFFSVSQSVKGSVLTLFYLINYLWLVEHLICISSSPHLFWTLLSADVSNITKIGYKDPNQWL